MSGGGQEGLRLAAEDAADLDVISAALQDAAFPMRDAAFDPKGRRLAVRLNRFVWEGPRRGPGRRVQALLLIEQALKVRSAKVRLGDPDAVASLLAIRFEPDDEPPGGVVRLILAGGGEIQAQVEALEVTLQDLSPSWRARARPRHEDA